MHFQISSVKSHFISTAMCRLMPSPGYFLWIYNMTKARHMNMVFAILYIHTNVTYQLQIYFHAYFVIQPNATLRYLSLKIPTVCWCHYCTVGEVGHCDMMKLCAILDFPEGRKLNLLRQPNAWRANIPLRRKILLPTTPTVSLSLPTDDWPLSPTYILQHFIHRHQASSSCMGVA